jgi:hypothetical protein
MSEPTVATAAPPPKKAKGTGLTKKVGPLPIWGWAALAAVGAGAYIWYRDRKAKSSSAGTASTTSTTSTAGIDESQLAAELAQLLNEEGQGGGASSSGTTGTTGSGGGTGTTTKTTSSTKTGTTSKTTAKTTARTTSSTKTTTGGGVKKPARAPHQIATSPRYDSATVSWGPVTGATQYRVVALHGSDKIHDAATGAHSANLNGLKTKTHYRWRVAAVNSAGTGPFSPDMGFETK